MERFFQLTDLDDGRVIGEYDSEIEALDTLRSFDPSIIEHLSLSMFNDGVPSLVAMERDLLDFVHPTKISVSVLGITTTTISQSTAGGQTAVVQPTRAILQDGDRYIYSPPRTLRMVGNHVETSS